MVQKYGSRQQIAKIRFDYRRNRKKYKSAQAQKRAITITALQVRSMSSIYTYKRKYSIIGSDK